MNKILLLSPELRAKVETKVRECLTIAETEYSQQFKMPEIRYDIKNTDGGRAVYGPWLIRFNLILLVENEEHFLNSTVPHEVAHLINFKINHPAPGKKRLMPHGQEWKKVMAVLKTPAKRTHTYNCQSIQRPKKRGDRLSPSISRIERITKMIAKLSLEDKNLVLHNILEME